MNKFNRNKNLKRKIRIRCNNIYENSHIQSEILSIQNNKNALGIDRPYEIIPKFSNKKQRESRKDCETQISAYSHCRSIAFWQFSPIFGNSDNGKDIIWSKELNCSNGRKIKFYANVFFKMGKNRDDDYKSAWRALKASVNSFYLWAEDKKLKESLLGLWHEIDDWRNKKIEVKNVKKTVNNPNRKPNDYTWHHVFMGFQNIPTPARFYSEPFNFLNPYIDIRDHHNICDNPYVVNFNYKDNEINDYMLFDCGYLNYGYNLQSSESADDKKLIKLRLLNKIEIYNSTFLDASSQQILENWNCDDHMAIMQLVETDIHSKTVHHVGSNLQRDIRYCQSEEDDDNETQNQEQNQNEDESDTKATKQPYEYVKTASKEEIKNFIEKNVNILPHWLLELYIGNKKIGEDIEFSKNGRKIKIIFCLFNEIKTVDDLPNNNLEFLNLKNFFQIKGWKPTESFALGYTTNDECVLFDYANKCFCALNYNPNSKDGFDQIEVKEFTDEEKKYRIVEKKITKLELKFGMKFPNKAKEIYHERLNPRKLSFYYKDNEVEVSIYSLDEIESLLEDSAFAELLEEEVKRSSWLEEFIRN